MQKNLTLTVLLLVALASTSYAEQNAETITPKVEEGSQRQLLSISPYYYWPWWNHCCCWRWWPYYYVLDVAAAIPKQSESIAKEMSSTPGLAQISAYDV